MLTLIPSCNNFLFVAENDEVIFDPHAATDQEISNHVTELWQESSRNLGANMQCSFCDHKTSKIDHLVDHSYIFHFHCLECVLTFPEQEEVFDHIEKIHKLKVKCDLCPFRTFRPFKLQSHHDEWHKNDKIGQKCKVEISECEFCAFKSEEVDVFLEHLNEDHNFCGTCDLPFGDQESVIGHLKHEHNKNVKCSNCDFLSFSSKALSEHSKTHQKVLSV